LERETRLELALHLFEKSKHFRDPVRLLYRFLYRFRPFGNFSVLPLKGLGSGVMEIALPYRGNAFRVVYAVQIGPDLWVVHAFQKKATQGIKSNRPVWAH
jgi:hypothetical protein